MAKRFWGQIDHTFRGQVFKFVSLLVEDTVLKFNFSDLRLQASVFVHIDLNI